METHRYGPSRRCVLSTGCFNVFWLSSLNIDKEPNEVRPSTKPQALRVPGRGGKSDEEATLNILAHPAPPYGGAGYIYIFIFERSESLWASASTRKAVNTADYL